MIVFRSGNHWGVTIVREAVPSPGPDHWHEGGPCEECPRDAELVAVVVNGDRELARRICDQLNDAWQLVEAIGILGEARRLLRTGKDDLAGWDRFDWMVEDFMRRRSVNPAHVPFCDGTCAKDPMANCPGDGVVSASPATERPVYAHDAHCNTIHEAGPQGCPPPQVARP